MKVLITGANGYLGRHVVEAVLAKGHEVLASDFNFDNLPETVIKVTTPIFQKQISYLKHWEVLTLLSI